jgi:hypothetical protein
MLIDGLSIPVSAAFLWTVTKDLADARRGASA